MPETPAAGMTGHDRSISIAENYRRFAAVEAAGKSPAYEQLAYAVASDPAVLAFLGTLPPPKRQPNLLFAAARLLLEMVPPDIHSLWSLISNRGEELSAVMNARRTQTNEAARCAVLLPALSQIPGPLALLEVGASAGLTLLHDFYSYDYAGHMIRGRDAQAPTLACDPRGPVPLPTEVPEIVWRAGLDLNPLDVGDDDNLHWLQCLIWPGESEREARLLAAAATARRHRPQVFRGDLLVDLPDLAAEAPADATLVIFHTAVLAYVEPRERRAFASLVSELGAVWLSNEGAGVLPHLPTGQPGDFLLVRDGTELLARSEGHASFVEWLAVER